MRRPLRFFVLFPLLLLFAVSNSSAQNPRSRGMWVMGGAGYASTGKRCHECANLEDQSGPTVFVRVGGVMTKKAVIAIDALGFRKSDDDGTTTMGSVTISGHFYPKRTSGLFIKLGLGFGFFSQDGGFYDGVDGNGGAATIGLGYDIRLTSSVSLTPIADFNFGDLGEMQQDNTDVLTGWRQTIMNVGMGLTWH